MSRKFDANPYYSPEKCMLEVLVTLDDESLSWEYDTAVVWIDRETGKLVAARDSGCSCPTPFEDYASTGDLIEINTVGDFDALVTGKAFDTGAVLTARRKVESYLDGMMMATAAVAAFRDDPKQTLSLFFEEIGAGSGREEELMLRITDLETELATARGFNDQYLQVIREQGEFIQDLRNAINVFTARERAGRF